MGDISPEMMAALQASGYLPGAGPAPAPPPQQVAPPSPQPDASVGSLGNIPPAQVASLAGVPSAVRGAPAPMTDPGRWASAPEAPAPGPQVSYGGPKVPTPQTAAQAPPVLPGAAGGAGRPAGWVPGTETT
jgi:hypothetical protein